MDGTVGGTVGGTFNQVIHGLAEQRQALEELQSKRHITTGHAFLVFKEEVVYTFQSAFKINARLGSWQIKADENYICQIDSNPVRSTMKLLACVLACARGVGMLALRCVWGGVAVG